MIDHLIKKYEEGIRLSIVKEDMPKELKSSIILLYNQFLQDLKELKEQTITYKDCIGVNTNGQRF